MTSKELLMLENILYLLMHIYLEKPCVMLKSCLNRVYTVLSHLEKNVPDGEGTPVRLMKNALVMLGHLSEFLEQVWRAKVKGNLTLKGFSFSLLSLSQI